MESISEIIKNEIAKHESLSQPLNENLDQPLSQNLSQPRSGSQSLFGSQPWSIQPKELSQSQGLSQSSSHSSLRAPVVTPDQREQRNEWNLDYRRQLKQKRGVKNQNDGKFTVDLKQWIRFGVISPGVNLLKYIDPEGKCHRASILPNGKLQADIRGAPLFPSVRFWLKTMLKLAGKGSNLRLDWEMKRVSYRRRSLFDLFGSFKKVKDETKKEEPEPYDENVDDLIF